MKKTLAILLAVTMLFALSACGSSGGAQATPNPAPGESTSVPDSSPPSQVAPAPEQEEPTGTPLEEIPAEGSNILIAFFSRAGENYNVGVIEKGNTHIVAEMIAEQTGGELFHIQTVTPYPESYEECTDVARQEQRDNARPALSGTVDNMADYDVVFLGYPNWWGDMPMAVYTFLESYDFTGKTIVPFATHEGSGLSSTESSIAAACPEATVLSGLAIRGATAQNAQNEANQSVVSWLSDLALQE